MRKLTYFSWDTLLLFVVLSLASCNQKPSLEVIPKESPSKHLITREIAFRIASYIDVTNYPTYLSNESSSLVKKEVEELVPVPDEKGEVVLYIVNYQEGGFVILSADDRVDPVLAYSKTGSFETKDGSNFPGGLIEWLSMTKEGIQKIREQNFQQDVKIARLWNRLKMPRLMQEPGAMDCQAYHEVVYPLLTTRWHQGCGFNDQMPPILGCRKAFCDHALAGCVPIAIAQVMKYYRHPTWYNWSRMLSFHSTPESASLIRNIFESIQGMQYSCQGTGVSHHYNIASVFTKSTFAYSRANQSGFNGNILRDQLRAKKPVILSGGRKGGWWLFTYFTDGHMWVCDGFTLGSYPHPCSHPDYVYYHMNWGWGNTKERDEWYAFGSFNPRGYDYNYQIQMVYNINP